MNDRIALKRSNGNGRLPLRLAVMVGLAIVNGCVSKSTAPLHADAQPVATLTPLPTGKMIQERFSVASQNVGSFPVNMILSADGKFAITTDEGYRQALWSIRTSDGAGVSHVNYPKEKQSANGLYYGLAITPDGTLYAAQGNADAIGVLKLAEDGTLQPQRTILTHKGDFPSGLALDGRGKLYVANNDPAGKSGATFAGTASVVIYEAAAGKEIGRLPFDDTIAGTSNFPLAVAVLNDGRKLYVASQRDSAVYVIDTTDPAKPRHVGKISSGSHPDALVLNKDQSKLFIANAHSDTISVVTTADDKITATVLLRPEIARDLPGATPTGLALSPDEKTLYATLADMNSVAVIDVASPQPALLGYIPTGWYPTAVATSIDGKRLLVTNAKGINPRNPNTVPGTRRQQSPLNLLEGTVSSIEVPKSKEALVEQTTTVMEDNRLTPRYIQAENPLKEIGLAAGKITHVVYIVKENRTYDQVLGDLPQGNGKADLCIFGREVTPNLHALAERFVLLDNFYDCGEVSGDGWTWTTQAHANEYVQRNVPYSYSSRGRSFDYEGTVKGYPTGGFPAVGPDGKPLSQAPQFKEGAKAIPDVAAAPGGHLWDLARAHGLSLRNYGFFVAGGSKSKDGLTVLPDNYPAVTGLQPGGHDLEGITDVDFQRFDLNYADSEAGLHYFADTKEKNFLYTHRTAGSKEMPSRFTEWKREFDLMLKKDPTGAAVPALMLVRFGDDHTQGANPGTHSPRSMVADNDYAVGQFVEAISHSSIWKNTAIFVIEDDAQNGPDHVDAHRSTCYVISPWIKKASVDHSFQNTVSCIKTMELLLGLPPMCQYDAVASPILNWDTTPSNIEPYQALAASKQLIAEINPDKNPVKPVSPELQTMIDQSKAMDFTVADRAPADELNQIIWQTVKGPGAVMPSSPQGPMIKAAMPPKAHDDDDDDDKPVTKPKPGKVDKDD